MKFSFIHNDKKTAKDEMVLFWIIMGCLVVGVLLAVLRPAFWIISAKVSTLAGVFLTFLGLMYIPCLLYRLATNEKTE